MFYFLHRYLYVAHGLIKLVATCFLNLNCYRSGKQFHLIEN